VTVGGLTVTVKVVADITLTPLMAAEIGPVVAPTGTVVTIWVDVQLDTTAAVPLKLTVLSARIALKFLPLMVTVAPTGALVGVTLLIIGDAPVAEVLLLPHPARRKSMPTNEPNTLKYLNMTTLPSALTLDCGYAVARSRYTGASSILTAP